MNADDQLGINQDLTSYNLFAYCGNNPVNREDPSGHFWKEIGNWFKKAATTVINFFKNDYSSAVGRTTLESLADGAMGVSSKLIKDSKSAYILDKGTAPLYNWTYTKYTTPIKSAQVAKGILKSGLITAGISFGIDVYDNCQHYNGMNIVKASAIDLGGLLLGIGAAALIAATAPVSAPAVLIFATTVAVGSVISIGTGHVKQRVLPYDK